MKPKRNRYVAPATPEPARCTGHCCRAFFLPYSPEEIHRAYLAWRDGKPVPRSSLESPEIPNLIDIHLVASMVRHLGFGTRRDVAPTAPISPTKGARNSAAQPGHFYTCVHLQPNGDCGIYDIRPAMCRDYPYGLPCRYLGCTFTGPPKAPATKSEADVREKK